MMILLSHRLVYSLKQVNLINPTRFVSNFKNSIKKPIKMSTITPTQKIVSYDLNAVVSTLKNGHPFNNVPQSIIEKVGSNLHLRTNHPLNIIKKRLYILLITIFIF